MNFPAMPLICPNCQKILSEQQKIWRCENNHCFDIAKNGDVNFLLPHHKRSRSPGDSKEMVAARQTFLASGAYQPVAERLAKYVMLLSQGMPSCIADAGCGDGFYLRQIKQLCYPQPHSTSGFIGWDISKTATQSAARSAKNANFLSTWFTASNAHIPIADNSFDILLSLFGFEVPDEFARVVKPQGFVITADTGENHLIEIREMIYPEINPYREKAPLAGFKLIKQEALAYELSLNADLLAALLLMTPHFFRATIAAKDALLSLTELSVTVSVNWRLYQR